MGEEARIRDRDLSADGDKVTEWEMGLPTNEDLASLSYSLIPKNLATAFRIIPEESRTIDDVDLALEKNLSSLRCRSSGPNTMEEEDRVGSSSFGSDPKKQKTWDDGVDIFTAAAVTEEGDSRNDNGHGAGESNPYVMQHNKFESMASYPSVGGGSANENN
ncbi:unnamed protein product [Cochlearia groenlandica]